MTEYLKKNANIAVILANYCTFVITVLATLQSSKTAYQGESFAFSTSVSENNIPPMPLTDAHLGGFFFYK